MTTLQLDHIESIYCCDEDSYTVTAIEEWSGLPVTTQLARTQIDAIWPYLLQALRVLNKYNASPEVAAMRCKDWAKLSFSHDRWPVVFDMDEPYVKVWHGIVKDRDCYVFIESDTRFPDYAVYKKDLLRANFPLFDVLYEYCESVDLTEAQSANLMSIMCLPDVQATLIKGVQDKSSTYWRVLESTQLLRVSPEETALELLRERSMALQVTPTGDNLSY